jgi:hypothetical protein
MKQASPAFISMLQNNSTFFRADLWQIVPLNPVTPMYYTSWPRPITVGTTVFQQGLPNFKRNRLSAEVGVKVTTLDMEMSWDSTCLLPNGNPMGTFIAGGGLTGAMVTLQTAIMLTPPTNAALDPLLAGVVTQFVGEVGGADSIGRSSGKFSVNSLLNRLDQYVPRNLIQPSCPFQLFDASCTVNPASFSTTGTVGAGSTANLIQCTLSQPTNWFQQGKIQFTSGVLDGLWFSIRFSSGTSITPTKTMGIAPAAGDTFIAFAGCDKTMSTCQSKFVNITNFGGYPFVPAPEATL